MHLGERISRYRKALGISQEELGSRLDVSRQAVSKWETGAAVPDMENLLALAREFGVSVAELTATPDGALPPQEAPRPRPKNTGWWVTLGGVLVLLIAMIAGMVYAIAHSNDGQESDTPVSPLPESEFLLQWEGKTGTEWLALGEQEGFFPFGTSLALTELEEVLDTDFHLTAFHRADCGALRINYLHMGYDPETDPEAPEREYVTGISTIVPGYTTPRDIGVGSTKAEVLAAYGDDLVYCLKQEGSDILVQHEYYYAYQSPETYGYSLRLYMQDGLVGGIDLQDMMDEGIEAFAPNNTTRFPLVDGEPDYSQRQEPELEEKDETQRVYIAWQQLVNNRNLSAEEQYSCRRDVFSLLPYLDWDELRQMGSAEDPDSTLFALMRFIEEQAPYSSAEILWIQMGCTANGLDGAYAERYADLLAKALFSDPLVFARALATDGVDEETKWAALLNSSYGADLYPAELKTALDTLDSYQDAFTQDEAGWAQLLRLYLATPINSRGELPRTPEELSS